MLQELLAFSDGPVLYLVWCILRTPYGCHHPTESIVKLYSHFLYKFVNLHTPPLWTDRGNQKHMPRPDSHLHHDLCCVLCSVGACHDKWESALSPWVHCSKFSSQESSLFLCPDSCWSSALAVLRMKFWHHRYCFPVRSCKWKTAVLLSAGLVACVGDEDRNITALATARQPETIILKFSKSVKSVVCERNPGSLALSAQGFSKSSFSGDCIEQSLKLRAAFWACKSTLLFHALYGWKHTCKEGPVWSHWPEIPEDVQKDRFEKQYMDLMNNVLWSKKHLLSICFILRSLDVVR